VLTASAGTARVVSNFRRLRPLAFIDQNINLSKFSSISQNFLAGALSIVARRFWTEKPPLICNCLYSHLGAGLHNPELCQLIGPQTQAKARNPAHATSYHMAAQNVESENAYAFSRNYKLSLHPIGPIACSHMAALSPESSDCLAHFTQFFMLNIHIFM